MPEENDTPAKEEMDAGDGESHGAGASPGPSGEPSRLRFAHIDLERLPSSGIRIAVRLTHRGEPFEGEAEGVGSQVVELRLAARATLEAVNRALGGSMVLELVGLKNIHAFDADLVLVAVRTGADPGQRLVGAVPVVDDACSTAVRATLDAVNRTLSRHLPGV